MSPPPSPALMQTAPGNRQSVTLCGQTNRKRGTYSTILYEAVTYIVGNIHTTGLLCSLSRERDCRNLSNDNHQRFSSLAVGNLPLLRGNIASCPRASVAPPHAPRPLDAPPPRSHSATQQKLTYTAVRRSPTKYTIYFNQYMYTQVTARTRGHA